ncbi:MAG: cysteine desulfurase, partial [Abitibacteriaceae bacterium]|nr:cysteine desulfurase [Abditibacteriaceae bacterium]
MPNRVDLDANASTRPDVRVIEAMTNALSEVWGNPSSDHILGKDADHAVTKARHAVAELIGAHEQEILFTSGATEAINLAIQGSVRAHASSLPHVITSSVEHAAVLETVAYLQRSKQIKLTLLKPDRFGRTHPDQVKKALRKDTILVCLIHGNNEIGTLNPLQDIGSTLRDHPARLFVDAAQTMGYCPPNVQACGIDMMSVSAHKMHGPKGIGALYVKGLKSLHVHPQTLMEPILFGGGQEWGYRSGTLNVSSIVGLGVTAEIAKNEHSARSIYVTKLRQRFLNYLQESIPDIQLNGDPIERLPSNLSLTIA